VQEAVGRALFVGAVFAVIGSAGLLGYPERTLSSVLQSKLHFHEESSLLQKIVSSG